MGTHTLRRSSSRQTSRPEASRAPFPAPSPFHEDPPRSEAVQSGGTNLLEAAEREVTAAATRRDDLRTGAEDAQRAGGYSWADETYDESEEVVLDGHGAPRRIITGGAAADPDDDSRIEAEGTRRVTRVEGGSGPLVSTDVDETTTRTTGGLLDRRRETRTEDSTRLEQLDPQAMAGDVIPTLEQRLAETSDDAERTRIERDIAALRADNVDVATVRTIRDRYPGARARQHLRTASESSRVVTESSRRSLRRGEASWGRSETNRTVEGNRTEESTESRENRLHLDNPGFTRTDSRRRVVTDTDADARFTDESTETSGVRVDRGIVARGSSQRRETIADASGETIRQETDTTTGNAGAHYDAEHGWGARLGGNRVREVVEGETTTTTDTGGEVTVQANRVAARGHRNSTARHGDMVLEQRASADGSFSFDLEPQRSEDPPCYLLTFRIHIGVNGRVGAGHDPEAPREGDARTTQVTARAHASAEAGGTLTTSRRLTPEQARAYLEEADTREGGDSGTTRLPEFGNLDRLVAAGDNADALARSSGLLGNADTARDMADGESLELDIDASAGVGGTLGVNRRGGGSSTAGGSIRAEAELQYRRRARIERIHTDGRDLVRIEVAFTTGRTWEAGGSGSLMGATAGGEYGEGTENAERVQVTLDPHADDYQDIYDRVMATLTPAELRSLAARDDVGRRITERETAHEDSDHAEGNAGFGVGPVNVAASVGEGHRTRETRRTDANGGTTVTVEGEHQASLGLRVGDTTLVDWDDDHQATAEATADGIDLDLQEDEACTDPLATAQQTIQAARGRSASDNLGRAVSQSPLAHLRAQLSQQHHRLSGVHVGPEEMEELVRRAANRRAWNRCGHGFDAMQAWWGVGDFLRVRQSIPEGEEARLQRNLDIARALTRFMRDHGADAERTFDHVLRHYGDDGRAGTSAVAAERLGEEYEWPPALNSAHRTWESLCAEIDGLGDRVPELAADRGVDVVEGMFTRIQRGLDTLRGQVEGCRDFESPTARSEVLGQIDVRLDEVRNAWARFHAGGNPTSSDTGNRLWQERIHRMERLLMSNKNEADRRLNAMRDELHDTFGTCSAVYEQASQVHDFYLTWYDQVVELRTLYGSVGIEPSQWKVSEGPHTPRKRLDPDMHRLRRYYLSAANRDLTPPMTFRSVAAEWLTEWQSY